MGYCSSYRLLVWLIAAFLLLCATAAPGDEWIGWAVPLSLLVILLIIDAMCVGRPPARPCSSRRRRRQPSHGSPLPHKNKKRRFSDAQDFVFEPSIKNYARAQARRS